MTSQNPTPDKLPSIEVVDHYLAMKCLQTREALMMSSVEQNLAIERTVRACNPKDKKGEENARALAQSLQLKNTLTNSSFAMFEALQIIISLSLEAAAGGYTERATWMTMQAAKMLSSALNESTPQQTIDKMIRELYQFAEVQTHES